MRSLLPQLIELGGDVPSNGKARAKHRPTIPPFVPERAWTILVPMHDPRTGAKTWRLLRDRMGCHILRRTRIGATDYARNRGLQFHEPESLNHCHILQVIVENPIVKPPPRVRPGRKSIVLKANVDKLQAAFHAIFDEIERGHHAGVVDAVVRLGSLLEAKARPAQLWPDIIPADDEP